MNNLLLQEFKLNDVLTLKNKIIMAPMTRAKATEGAVPTMEMADYYARRAAAGLIISEATVITPNGFGYSHVPGIFSEQQINGWKIATEKVHQKNGLMFLQLWHVGRVSHPYFLDGELPVSSSATMMSGRISRTQDLHYGQSRELTLEEISQLVEAYAIAAKNARLAGFDGVEIHGANGYLIDQFLHYDTNKRQDEYGANPENMARFALEIVNACGKEIGYERVGLRLSPGAYMGEIIGDIKDRAVFQYLLNQLNFLTLAYLHVGNFNDQQRFPELNELTMSAFMRQHYTGTLIASGGYTLEQAQLAIVAEQFDLIAIGRPFIANHNLIEMLTQNTPLQEYQVSMLDRLY